MKIAFLVNSLRIGGAERVVIVLVEKLYEMGYDVELICLESNNQYYLDSKIPVTYLTSNSGNESSVKKLLLMPFLAMKLLKKIKDKNITLVQSHVYRANYVNLLAKLFGGKYTAQCVTHGITSCYYKKGLLGKINIFLIRKLFPNADLLLFVSIIAQKDFQNVCPTMVEQKVIYNPYQYEKIIALSNEVVSEFKFSCHIKYIIAVGRLIPLKRVNDIISIMSKFNDNYHLIILGDGPEISNLEQQTQAAKLNSRISFLGNVENPYKFIRNSNVLVVASDSESFGNVVVESFICKTPVIASDCGGPTEIIAPELPTSNQLNNLYFSDYGALYPIGDLDSLKEGIDIILNDAELSKSIVESSFKYSEKFSETIIIKQYIELLKGE